MQKFIMPKKSNPMYILHNIYLDTQLHTHTYLNFNSNSFYDQQPLGYVGTYHINPISQRKEK